MNDVACVECPVAAPRASARLLIRGSFRATTWATTWAVIGVAIGGLGRSAEAAPPAPRPNVLLICVDDLKPALGCYGDPSARTPNIDRLAARGVRFERAYCNQAVCSPSRNALLTGLRPQTLGIYDLGTNFRRAAPTIRTLPQLFRDAGWHAEALGKIFHVGHGNRDDAASWSEPLFRGRTVQYQLPENRGPSREGARFDGRRDAAKLPRGAAMECADVEDDAYDDGRIATEAVRRLKAAAARPTEPFLMAIGFHRPHLPFVAPKRYWDLHDPATLPMPLSDAPPAGAPPYAATRWGELREYRDVPRSGPVGEALARRLVHGYYAATTYMDAQVGRVLEALEATGLAETTIVVLWGDHGWHLGDHGMWCKHTAYEQATRIPLIVAAPGMPRGAASGALVESVDILPTLLELAGLPAVPGRDGASFVPVLADPAAAFRDHCIQVYPRGLRLGRAIRTDSLRLVEWREFGAPPDAAEIELYDYAIDPGETRNLAAERPADVAALRTLLATHPAPRPPVVAAAGGTVGDRVVETVHEPSDVDFSLPFRTRYSLWIPEGEGALRGLIVHQHGCGKGASDGSRTGIDDLQWRALARRQRCGLLVPTYETTDGDDCRRWCDPRNGSDEAFLAALGRLAVLAERPEIEVVPWCLWGHSGGGFWATIMLERHPERIVAVWLRSGSPFPAWRDGQIPALEFPDAAFGVPLICNPGLQEKGDARFAAAWTGAIDTLAHFRARHAPAGFAPDPKTGHECGESRTLAIPFFDAMLEARLPEVAGAAGPLRPLDVGAGLVAPLGDDDWPGPPLPEREWHGDRTRSVWLPDERFARLWSEYLRDGFPSDESPPPAPREGRSTRGPDGHAHLAWRADADLESGLAGFIVRREGREVGRIDGAAAGTSARPLFQGLSYHDTPSGPATPMEFAPPEPPADGTRFEVVAINGAGLESHPLPIVVGAP